MQVLIDQPQNEEMPYLAIAEFSLHYDLHKSSSDREKDSDIYFLLERTVVTSHFDSLSIKITNALQKELHGEFILGEIEYTKGSVKVSGKVLAAWVFIVPIIQGYIVNQMPPLDQLFDKPTTHTKSEAIDKYSKICKKVEHTTMTTISEFEESSNIASSKTEIKTHDIKKVCHEWMLQQLP